MMRPKSILSAMVALGALAASVMGSCDDRMVKCYACDPNMYADEGGCKAWLDYFARKTDNTDCVATIDLASSAALKSLPMGLRYLGFAWAGHCYEFLSGCNFCSGAQGGTGACRDRYGSALASGEQVFGSCTALGYYQDENVLGGDYDWEIDEDASAEERKKVEKDAYLYYQILSPDPYAFVNKPAQAKSYAPPGRKAGRVQTPRRYGKRFGGQY